MYKSIIQSKTGIKIPVLESGRTLESRYDPQKDAERQFSSYKGEGFVIITGFGSGVLSELILKNTNAHILAVEYSEEDIDFLRKEGFFKDKSRINICSLKNFYNTFLSSYFPCIHGNLCILENKTWISENQDLSKSFKTLFNDALQRISADFSVQSHFGKIWQNNIIHNLKLSGNSDVITPKIISPSEKYNKAVILGAGPSIDAPKLISRLEKKDFYLIATDTAFSILSKYKIVPDCVVSLDGQILSHCHFMNRIYKDTLFILDLCINPSITRHLIKYPCPILFSVSGHPLAMSAFNHAPASFISLNAGSGTVTMAALDFAVKTGFSEIELYGADSAYHKGKAYAKGTYLDCLYQKDSLKNKNTESFFTKLMYRTPLEETAKGNETIYQSTVLKSYQTSIEQFISSIGSWNRKEFAYFIKSTQKKHVSISTESFPWETFRNKLIAMENKTFNIDEITAENIVIELPLMARLRLEKNITDPALLYEVALKELLRITR